MKPLRRVRGRPLVALLAILVTWSGMRWVYFDVPQFGSGAPAAVAASGPAAGDHAIFADAGRDRGEELISMPEFGVPSYVPAAYDAPARPVRRFAVAPPVRFAPLRWQTPYGPLRKADWLPEAFARRDDGLEPWPVTQGETRPVPVRAAVAQNMLWMAAMSQMPVPPGFDRAEWRTGSHGSGRSGPYPALAEAAARPSRWSADSWMLLRRGGDGGLVSGIVPATYGASQAGAVLRYRLAPHSGHRPAAYLRATSALNGSREKDVALGLSARPLSRVPIVAAAELRASDQAGATRLRPAVLAWTELPSVNLPLGARLEAYAQAGYVGGKFSTPFADGQVRADTSLLKLGKADLRAGGGVWGGAQKGASRLDVGPTATMAMPLGGTASARVAVDWRFRVGGHAAPQSGPALTLSAGF